MRPSWGNMLGLPHPLSRICVTIAPRHAMISAPFLPLTQNAMWRHFKGRTIVHPDAKTYTQMLQIMIGRDAPFVRERISNPFGLILILESSRWVTQRATLLKSDVDNRIKTAIDFLMKSVGEDCDHNCTEVHAFKLQSHEERTTFFLYEKPINVYERHSK
jgi:Holliday junction resolvase RusA-like endonuclease